ncbi:MAG: hypothetical protein IAX21_08380 [Candidatus Bathyarchaeota archaeon]|nr:MAG: hypothetical protein IAX21_08380 [Candidatus Bathyarchaeota archaeon]
MMHLFSKKDKITPNDTKKLYAQLIKHGIPQTAAKNIIKFYEQTTMPKNSYTCKNCGYVLPKKDAIISGYNSQNSLRHIHCPKCKKIITYVP